MSNEVTQPAQPRDDVRSAVLEDRINVWNFVCEWRVHSEGQTLEHQKGQDYAATQIARALYEGKPDIDTALSQTDEQPDTHDMTDAECATAYRDLRKRANDAGFATVGEWIDEQLAAQGTDGLAELFRRAGSIGNDENVPEEARRVIEDLHRALAEGLGEA